MQTQHHHHHTTTPPSHNPRLINDQLDQAFLNYIKTHRQQPTLIVMHPSTHKILLDHLRVQAKMYGHQTKTTTSLVPNYGGIRIITDTFQPEGTVQLYKH